MILSFIDYFITFRYSHLRVFTYAIFDFKQYCRTHLKNWRKVPCFSASAVAWCFVVQMTFFGSCLAIHARRVNRYRHCITCLRVKTRHHLQREGEKNPLKLICCAGTSNETTEELDSIMQRFVKHYTKKIFLNSFSKVTTIFSTFLLKVSTLSNGSSKHLWAIKFDCTNQCCSNFFKTSYCERLEFATFSKSSFSAIFKYGRKIIHSTRTFLTFTCQSKMSEFWMCGRFWIGKFFTTKL